jgi:hypothetical protein
MPLVRAATGAAPRLSMGREADLAALLGRPTPSPRANDGRASRGVSALSLRARSAANGGDLGALYAAVDAAVSMRRSSGPEGSKPVLTRDAHQRIDHLLAHTTPKTAAALEGMVARLDGPAAPTARALLVKAIAARALALGSGDRERLDAALLTLEAFTRHLDHADDGEALLARATTLDLDSTRDSVDGEPLVYERTAGTVRLPALPGRADNDGLLQRFTGSCGPTTLQMVLCEEDPVRAFVVNDAGEGSIAANDVVASYQAELLAEHRAFAIGRRAKLSGARIRNGLAQLGRTGRAGASDVAALRTWVDGEGTQSAGARRALRALRSYTGGFPTTAELREVRADPQRGETGMTTEDFAAALDRELAWVTGRRYEATPILRRGGVRPYLDTVARALRRGLDVPFGVVEAVHWMLLTGVRGRGHHREFLVSDPYSGRTVWVGEASLISGDFVAGQLGLLPSGSKDWIETFLIPR